MEDVKRILSTLWIARMLASLQGDVVHFLQPGMLEEMIAGTTEIPITNEMLLVMTIIMMVPIFMSFLSLVLKYKANRWANLSIGIFFIGFEIIFLILLFSSGSFPVAVDILLNIVYLVFAALVVWYAWKWPKQEG